MLDKHDHEQVGEHDEARVVALASAVEQRLVVAEAKALALACSPFIVWIVSSKTRLFLN